MNVLLYLSEGNEKTAIRLLDAVRTVVSGHLLEILRDYQKLTVRLNKLPQEISMGVFLTQSRDQLLELITLRSVMEDIRTILIIPDDENVTIALGHLLRPTLLTSVDAEANFADVAAVLAKCIG